MDWPWSKEIIHFLEGKKYKEIVADRKSGTALASRAASFTLAADGLLLRTGIPNLLEGVPLIPPLVMKNVPGVSAGGVEGQKE